MSIVMDTFGHTNFPPNFIFANNNGYLFADVQGHLVQNFPLHFVKNQEKLDRYLKFSH